MFSQRVVFVAALECGDDSSLHAGDLVASHSRVQVTAFGSPPSKAVTIGFWKA